MELPRWNVFFRGRNTGVVQSAKNPKEAVKLICERSRKPAGAIVNGKCSEPVAVVKLSGKDLKDAIKGKWLRVRADGSRNTSVGEYLFRPQLKKLSKGKAF